MPICANMGQSVAIAASIAVKRGIEVRDVPVADIQARLLELGIEI